MADHLEVAAAPRQHVLARSVDPEDPALVQDNNPFVFLHQDALAPQNQFKNARHRSYSSAWLTA